MATTGIDVVEVFKKERREVWRLRSAEEEFTAKALKANGHGALSPRDIANELDVAYDMRKGKVCNVRRYAPVPEDIRRILDVHDCNHSGLQLEKYAYRSSDQAFAKGALEKVIAVNSSGNEWYASLVHRWSDLLGAMGVQAPFRCVTVGPLTLHLSRATTLENAGICLHPLYGFVYLPGTGLKGMARAYAETVWVPTQPNAQQAWAKIEAVFGRSPGSDKNKPWKPKNTPSPVHDSAAGQIVFHDAWPTSWPRLELDVVNNHHGDYYQGKTNAPPGDWQSPSMVYFLAVAPGTEFQFGLAKRAASVSDDLLDLARQWLLGALVHEGAGAKTAAGYGGFKPVAVEAPKLDSPAREQFEATLELVTPAFLAGAKQESADCDLRPATLRGLLRWWWRTMHAGYVEVPTLHRLEAAIWGDTKSGGAVRVTVRPAGSRGGPVPVPGKEIKKDKRDKDVLRADWNWIKQTKLIATVEQKTTQGFLYLSYGMDEMPAGKREERKHRFITLPGAKWHVVMSARDSFYHLPQAQADTPPKRIPASMVLQQAHAALWLLCQYGGVGSKARNGFGSLGDLGGGTDSGIQRLAADLRRYCEIPELPQDAGPHKGDEPLSIPTPWRNYWFVLDQLGASIQAFAKKYKRTWLKEALGLPRKIGISDDDGSRDRHYERVRDNQTKQKVVWLGQNHPFLGHTDPKDMRHAAPVHLHVGRGKEGTYCIRVTTFPCADLPDLDTSRRVLIELCDHLASDMADRRRRYGDGPPPVEPKTGAPAPRAVL